MPAQLLCQLLLCRLALAPEAAQQPLAGAHDEAQAQQAQDGQELGGVLVEPDVAVGGNRGGGGSAGVCWRVLVGMCVPGGEAGTGCRESSTQVRACIAIATSQAGAWQGGSRGESVGCAQHGRDKPVEACRSAVAAAAAGSRAGAATEGCSGSSRVPWVDDLQLGPHLVDAQQGVVRHAELAVDVHLRYRKGGAQGSLQGLDVGVGVAGGLGLSPT